MTSKGPSIEDLEKYISESETVQLAITEAIHRFYYDHCFDPRTLRPYDTPEVVEISKAHNVLSRIFAGWRFKLKKRLERYNGWEDTTAILHQTHTT